MWLAAPLAGHARERHLLNQKRSGKHVPVWLKEQHQHVVRQSPPHGADTRSVDSARSFFTSLAKRTAHFAERLGIALPAADTARQLWLTGSLHGVTDRVEAAIEQITAQAGTEPPPQDDTERSGAGYSMPVLLQAGLGDAEVSTVGAAILARAYRAYAVAPPPVPVWNVTADAALKPEDEQVKLQITCGMPYIDVLALHDCELGCMSSSL